MWQLKQVSKMLFGLIAISFTVSAANDHVEWGYDGKEGPANWGQLSPEFSLCETGKNQSPINIQGALKTHHEKIKLTSHLGKQELINNGHTIQINVGEGNTLWLDNQIFNLQQFHFHSPSENDINGKQYPLEAHFVYKDKADNLAVLALLFKEGKSNRYLGTSLATNVPTDLNKAVKLVHPIDIKKLLPKKRGYYRFSGSLTTPPCTEGVRWLLLSHTGKVSSKQIEQFHQVLHHNNNRPLQPLNGRVIIE